MRLLRTIIVALGLVGGLNAASAAWPDRPTTITVVVGANTGGAADVGARVFAPFLAKHLGPNATTVVVNMPGAGGEISFNDIAQADPDGTKINIASMPNLVARLVEDKDNAYSLDDFTYLGQIIRSHVVLIVPKDSKYQTLQDVVSAAKASPGKVPFAVGALGNDDHLFALSLMSNLGVQFQIVPFGDGNAARNALLGGHVEVGSLNSAEAHGYREEFRVLALFADERLPDAPDWPTGRELGVDVKGGSSRGIIAPKGLPSEITDALAAAIKATTEDPEYLEQMKKVGIFTSYMSPADYEAFLRDQLEELGALFAATPWK